MYSKELDNLIDACLVDGKLDDLEKQALVERAEKEGVSQTELLVYINSILQKRAQTKNAEEDAREEERMLQKKKEIGRTCPHCGTVMPPLADKCPGCGEWVLTPGLNDKLEKEFEAIRQELMKLEEMPANYELENAARAAKSRVSTLQLRYTSIEKVQTFCNITGKRIDELEKKGKQGASTVLLIVGLMSVVCFGTLIIAALLEGIVGDVIAPVVGFVVSGVIALIIWKCFHKRNVQ